MCIIVDADKLGKFLAEPPDQDAAPIHGWLNRRLSSGVVVYSTGGRFAKEVVGGSRTKLADYARSGKAHLIPPEQFATDEQVLQADDKLRSNDAHVLALARASGARVLYTGTGTLWTTSRTGISSTGQGAKSTPVRKRPPCSLVRSAPG